MNDLSLPSELATNEEIAHVLFKVASVLEMLQENPYRVRAYRRTAIRILLLSSQLVEAVIRNEDFPLPELGDRMRNRLRDLINTGHLGVYETLLEEVGEPLASLIQLHGVGPKTALKLIRELNIETLDDLAQAARDGRIRTVRGFGLKREAAIGREAEARLEGAA